MLDILKQIERFANSEYEFRVRTTPVSGASKFIVFPTVASNPILYSDFASKLAPRLGWSGGGLVSTSGDLRTIEFYPMDYGPDTVDLQIKIYESDDDVTYSIIASGPYNSAVAVESDKAYVVGVVEAPDGTIVYTTKDEIREYRPLDPRYTYAEVRDSSTDVIEDILLYKTPIFVDLTTNDIVIDVEYRGVDSFTPLNGTLNGSEDGLVFYRERIEDAFGLIGRTITYGFAGTKLARNYIFPFQSPKTLSGHWLTRSFDIYTLTEYVVLLSKLRKLDSYFESLYSSVVSAIKSLSKEPDTHLFYSVYRTDGEVVDNAVDIAANVYLSVRFLSSGEKELEEFVLIDNGTGTSVVDLISVLRNADGFVPDKYLGGGTYENLYRGFTEGFFYFLQSIVSEYHKNYAPANFNKTETLNSILQWIDTVGHNVNCSQDEFLGGTTECRSQDLVAILGILNSIPYSTDSDYTAHINEIKTKLSNFYATKTNVECSNDPNNPNYNVDWCGTGTIRGLVETVSEGVIDSRWTLLLKAFDEEEFAYNVVLTPMISDDGILRVPEAVPASDKFITPDAFSTFIDVNLSLSGDFVRSGTFTIQILNELPVDVSIVQTPTNDGVKLDISLSYAVGIVVLAIGESTNFTYDSAISTTPNTKHSVVLSIPSPGEIVRIYVIPTRDYNVV